MDWIRDVLDCTAENEAPERYFWWSAISAISAVCRRNISLNRYFYRLFPNTFTLLIGPSGLKKGVPISLAEKLVRQTDITMIYNGRGSIQGIIKDLGKVYTHKNRTTSSDAKCFLVSPEFDTMLVDDDHAFSLLTDLYDTHLKDEWKNVIKGTGTDELKNIYMTILGASNENNLSMALPKSAVKGGFIARTCIIFEDTEKCVNPLTSPPKVVPNYQQLSKRLHQIANLGGEFIWDESAKQFYDEWYNILKGVQKTDATGTLNRLHDTVLKVAMCISLSKKDELVLERSDVEEATVKCEENVSGMRRIFLGHGRHPSAEVITEIFRIMLTKADGKVSRKALVGQLFGIADTIDMDKSLDTLIQGGHIESDREGDTIIYRIRPEVIHQYSNLRKKLVH